MKKTPLNQSHRDLGARMVDFGGWDMPVSTPVLLMSIWLYARSPAFSMSLTWVKSR